MSTTRSSWIEIGLLAAIVALVTVIAVPGILVSKKSVNESAAVGALRSLNAAETSYYNRHPATGFTCSLEELGSERLIDPRTASGTRSGYRLWGSGCRSGTPKSAVITEYQWFADPVNQETGTRHFCTDQSALVRGSDQRSGPDCLVLGAEQ
jgi:type II secretory pathway pseudopilin PulG